MTISEKGSKSKAGTPPPPGGTEGKPKVVVFASNSPHAAQILRSTVVNDHYQVVGILVSKSLAGRRGMELYRHLKKKSGRRFARWYVKGHWVHDRWEDFQILTGIRLRDWTKDSVKLLAKDFDLPLVVVDSVIREPGRTDALRTLRAWQPDVLATVIFPEKLAPEFLDVPSRGGVNCHGSMLPKYRGLSPDMQVVARGDKEHGVTTHILDNSFDTGKILHQVPYSVEGMTSLAQIEWKNIELFQDILPRSLAEMCEGRAEPREQDSKGGSYYGLPSEAIWAKVCRKVRV